MGTLPNGRNDKRWCDEHGYYRATCEETGKHPAEDREGVLREALVRIEREWLDVLPPAGHPIVHGIFQRLPQELAALAAQPPSRVGYIYDPEELTVEDRKELRRKFDRILDDRWPLAGKLLQAVDEYVAALATPDQSRVEGLADRMEAVDGDDFGHGEYDDFWFDVDGFRKALIAAALAQPGPRETGLHSCPYIYDNGERCGHGHESAPVEYASDALIAALSPRPAALSDTAETGGEGER